MAGFKTHITVSTVLGVGYGTAAYFLYGAPLDSCIVAGGLCSIAGMLPDLDSDSGTPVREMVSLIAAATPMLMINRFKHLGWSEEGMASAAIVIYCVIRFGLAELFKRYTVHRGMWHSIPACAIAGLITFMVASGEDFEVRMFKACAVVLGFMSHLVVDEIWSVKIGPGGVQVKRSFGTAIKFWGGSTWGNISVYAKLVIVALLALGDPVMMERFNLGDHEAPLIARGAFNSLLGKIEKVQHRLEQGENWRLIPRDELSNAFSTTAPARAVGAPASEPTPNNIVVPPGFSPPAFAPQPTRAPNDPILPLPDPVQATQPQPGAKLPRY